MINYLITIQLPLVSPSPRSIIRDLFLRHMLASTKKCTCYCQNQRLYNWHYETSLFSLDSLNGQSLANFLFVSLFWNFSSDGIQVKFFRAQRFKWKQRKV